MDSRVGDIIDGFLSISIVKMASSVSGGLDKHCKRAMYRNIIKQVAFGAIPFVGDLADSLLKANTRNFLILEDMLTARVHSAHSGICS